MSYEFGSDHRGTVVVGDGIAGDVIGAVGGFSLGVDGRDCICCCPMR